MTSSYPTGNMDAISQTTNAAFEIVRVLRLLNQPEFPPAMYHANCRPVGIPLRRCWQRSTELVLWEANLLLKVGVLWSKYMTKSSNGNIFRVTGPWRGESIGHRWIHLTMTSDTELWFFLWARTNGWANNQDGRGLRRYGGHFDVVLMHDQCVYGCDYEDLNSQGIIAS